MRLARQGLPDPLIGAHSNFPLMFLDGLMRLVACTLAVSLFSLTGCAGHDARSSGPHGAAGDALPNSPLATITQAMEDAHPRAQAYLNERSPAFERQMTEAAHLLADPSTPAGQRHQLVLRVEAAAKSQQRILQATNRRALPIHQELVGLNRACDDLTRVSGRPTPSCLRYAQAKAVWTADSQAVQDRLFVDFKVWRTANSQVLTLYNAGVETPDVSGASANGKVAMPVCHPVQDVPLSESAL